MYNLTTILTWVMWSAAEQEPLVGVVHHSKHTPKPRQCLASAVGHGQAPVVLAQHIIHLPAVPGGVPELKHKPLPCGQHLLTCREGCRRELGAGAATRGLHQK